MKNFVSLFVMLLVCIGCWIPVASAQDEVTFTDSDLEYWVQIALHDFGITMAQFAPVTVQNMENSAFKSLSIGASDITPPQDEVINSLGGLEHAKNLESLIIWNHAISDLSPLQGLTKLKDLNLTNNKIRDLTPLANLTNLESLGIGNNDLRDIPPLGNLTKLTQLTITNNQNLGDNIAGLGTLTALEILSMASIGVRDISPLRNLKNLEQLELGDNQIRDISPLQDLTEVFVATFEGNQIRDISPIAGWRKMILKGSTLNRLNFAIYDFWTFKNIKANPLSYSSIYTHLPNIMEAHIFPPPMNQQLIHNYNVIYDFRAPTTLEVVSGDGQTVGPGEALPEPLVVRVLDENGEPFASVPVTFAVTAGEGAMNPAETATLDPTYNLRDEEEGEAQTTFTAGTAIGPQTVVATVIRKGARSYQNINWVFTETVAFEGSTTLQATFTINVQPGAIAAPTLATVDPPYPQRCLWHGLRRRFPCKAMNCATGKRTARFGYM